MFCCEGQIIFFLLYPCIVTRCGLSKYILLEWSKEILELCKEFKNKGVVAMDLAGQEFHPGVDPDECAHRRAFVVCMLVVWTN